MLCHVGNEKKTLKQLAKDVKGKSFSFQRRATHFSFPCSDCMRFFSRFFSFIIVIFLFLSGSRCVSANIIFGTLFSFRQDFQTCTALYHSPLTRSHSHTNAHAVCTLSILAARIRIRFFLFFFSPFSSSLGKLVHVVNAAGERPFPRLHQRTVLCVLFDHFQPSKRPRRHGLHNECDAVHSRQHTCAHAHAHLCCDQPTRAAHKADKLLRGSEG